jgi:ankyrin repeat protein
MYAAERSSVMNQCSAAHYQSA